MTTEQLQTQRPDNTFRDETASGNGAARSSGQSDASGARVISDPNEVATLVLMQIDAVNARKDDLTIVIKALSDLARQLARAYADQSATIQMLRARIKELETGLMSK